MRVAAVVLAAGRGERFGIEDNKVYLRVRGRPIIAYSLDTLDRAEMVKALVVVAREQDHPILAPILAGLSISARVVEGGPTRHQSEAAALRALADEAGTNDLGLIAVHDGARPFMTLELLASCVDLAAELGGAIPGLPVESEIRTVDHQRVSPVDMTKLIRVQTPQVFEARGLQAAYLEAAAAGFEGADTAATVERFSDLRIGVVPGDARNLKITLPSDLDEAAGYALDWRDGRWINNPRT